MNAEFLRFLASGSPMFQAIGAKCSEAAAITLSCFCTSGVQADPTRYRHQCWTRDLGIAVAPLLEAVGHTAIVATHLNKLAARQEPNGQIPILFLNDVEGWYASKLVREEELKAAGRDRPSFMLERFRAGELWNLTPGTKDSEIIYVIAVLEYVRATGDEEFLKHHQPHIDRAVTYIEKHLVTHEHLVVGCDWRDTMEKALADKTLLTNNALLAHMYCLLNRKGSELSVIDAIRDTFLSGEQVLDYPGETRFDPLGASYAVLYDVATPEHYPKILAGFKSVDTPHGVTIKCRHNPLDEDEAKVIEETDGIVVWPWIAGFTILALLKMGEHAFACEQFIKMTRLKGYREYYDPRTGLGYGAQKQLWSATLYLRNAFALFNPIFFSAS